MQWCAPPGLDDSLLVPTVEPSNHWNESMRLFANQNHHLTVMLGGLVYELPMKSADQAQRLAQRASVDRDISDLLVLACRAAPKIASRSELESRDDPRLMVWNGPHALPGRLDDPRTSAS